MDYGLLDWAATSLTIVAAFLVASDFGRRVTGFGFILFVLASCAWIGTAVKGGNLPLGVANSILLLINAWGVWQYLLNPRKKKVIDRVEKVAEKIERQVEAEEKAEAA